MPVRLIGKNTTLPYQDGSTFSPDTEHDNSYKNPDAFNEAIGRRFQSISNRLYGDDPTRPHKRSRMANFSQEGLDMILRTIEEYVSYRYVHDLPGKDPIFTFSVPINTTATKIKWVKRYIVGSNTADRITPRGMATANTETMSEHQQDMEPFGKRCSLNTSLLQWSPETYFETLKEHLDVIVSQLEENHCKIMYETIQNGGGVMVDQLIGRYSPQISTTMTAPDKWAHILKISSKFFGAFQKVQERPLNNLLTLLQSHNICNQGGEWGAIIPSGVRDYQDLKVDRIKIVHISKDSETAESYDPTTDMSKISGRTKEFPGETEVRVLGNMKVGVHRPPQYLGDPNDMNRVLSDSYLLNEQIVVVIYPLDFRQEVDGKRDYIMQIPNLDMHTWTDVSLEQAKTASGGNGTTFMYVRVCKVVGENGIFINLQNNVTPGVEPSLGRAKSYSLRQNDTSVFGRQDETQIREYQGAYIPDQSGIIVVPFLKINSVSHGGVSFTKCTTGGNIDDMNGFMSVTNDVFDKITQNCHTPLVYGDSGVAKEDILLDLYKVKDEDFEFDDMIDNACTEAEIGTVRMKNLNSGMTELKYMNNLRLGSLDTPEGSRHLEYSLE